MFEFVGLSEAPEAVHTEEGSALEKAADLPALNAQASGWAYDATARGGTLWIKLGPDVTVVEVHHQP